ncbi:AI-2E family transporter [Rehaibacterium terrae]|jgi:predicted PurR-regulated permease PerM|uniref:Putative PurR-regulated permease PerM n=1 Tax=Rehaibacterium terrae TaxID=1341696 RepID=A0A7W7XYJ1_9GAMM|nr:AI-2E family transporter [Rehaibacterium terrae]MBB5014788.1 putative PurR-regulated permease PerM [Rehaibacterium terrae]
MSGQAPAPAAGPRQPGALAGTLLVLALLYTAWAASSLLIPIVLAMFLGLIANPIVRGLQKLWIPRWLGALGVVVGGVAAAVLLASVLVRPAAEWVRQAPSEIRQHAPKLRALTKPFEEANRAASESLSQLAGQAPQAPSPVQIVEPAPSGLWSVLSGTPITLASVGAIVLLAYFFLLYGENLQRRAITLLPDRAKQRVTVEILRTIESEVSRYVLTITVINIGLGAATAAALWGLGLKPGDALLWGTVVGLLNYAPYFGPLVGTIALTLVGMVAFKELGQALLVPAAYLAINLVESQLVTPIVLGRRMAISPLILLLWLMLWGWLWGVAGLLLAVPMLVTFKIVSARIDGWQGWAQVMED